MDEEREHYTKLSRLTHEISLDVIHLYFEIKILDKELFFLFLDRCKHVLFHALHPAVSCCECKNGSIPLSQPRRLYPDEFNLLFNIESSTLRSHHIETIQHCSCEYSASRSVQVDSLDISLVYKIVKICCPSIHGKPQWIQDVKDTRNFLVHKSNRQLTKDEYDTRLALVENATLQLAKVVSTKLCKMTQQKISDLKKDKLLSYNTVKDMITSSNEDVCKRLEFLVGNLITQEYKCKDELSIDISELASEVKTHIGEQLPSHKIIEERAAITALPDDNASPFKQPRVPQEHQTKKMEALKVFISHSSKDEDYELVYKEVIPKLEAKNIRIYGQEMFVPGNHVLPTITKIVDITEKTLVFMSKNAVESSWCSFELLISLERAQRTNRLSVVLLLHGISASEIPHIAILQEARKICFKEGQDDWVNSAVEALRETKTITGDAMPAGNVAHGLVWSHYAGFLQYVLPVLKKTLMESPWYKRQSVDVQSRVSWKLYELVPSSCTCKYNLSIEDENIKEVTTIVMNPVMRGGNHQELSIKLYSVTNGEQTYYCICEYPSVIGTMKVMEDNHLATFCHNYPATNDNRLGITSAPFTTDDKKLQLDRFCYTMNSVLNHFDNCRDTARVLLFNDERQKISEVLMRAVQEDLPQTKELKEEILPPQLDKLESTGEHVYEYQVYIAHTKHDEEKAVEISKYLKSKGIYSILNDETSGNSVGQTRAQQVLFPVLKCRWFVVLLTRKALEDDLIMFSTLSALSDSIYKREVRVIPVVDRTEDLYIPKALRWVTYIPFDDSSNRGHLKSLYSIVSGRDIPMETQFLLPAGDVAYGLAWEYVTNYLRKVLPDILDQGILPALRKENVGAFRCPHKLFIIIPKSCEAGNMLKDMKHNQGRLVNFAITAPVYPVGSQRPFHCTIYKLSTDDSLNEHGLYFVGQYAAPVTCLNEMREWNIAGVTADTMATEAYRFYQIVSQLMEQAVPEKAKYCEFIFFDDINTSLTDIMEEKIRSVEVQYTN